MSQDEQVLDLIFCNPQYRRILLPFNAQDPRSWFLYRQCVRDFFRKLRSKRYRLLLDRVLAGMMATNDPKGREQYWEQAENLSERVFYELYPLGKAPDEPNEQAIPKSEIEKMQQTWESVFGKRGDPKTEKAIQETAKRLFGVRKRG